MFEKIKAKLLLQREKTSHVSDRSLEDLARSLVTIITTDEQLEAMDLGPAIKSLDGNINHYTADQIKKQSELDASEKSKKEKEEAERKKAEQEKTKMDEDKDTPEWAKILIKNQAAQDEVIKAQQEALQKLQSDKVITSRTSQFEESIKGLPAYLVTPLKKTYEKANFESEEDFKAYLEDVKSTKDEFIKTANEQGLSFPVPSVGVKKVEKDNQTPELKSALDIVEKEKAKQIKK